VDELLEAYRDLSMTTSRRSQHSSAESEIDCGYTHLENAVLKMWREEGYTGLQESPM